MLTLSEMNAALAHAGADKERGIIHGAASGSLVELPE